MPDVALHAAAVLAAEVAVERGDGPALVRAPTGRTPWPEDLVVVR